MKPLCLAVAIVLIPLLIPRSSFAQTPPARAERPYRGLFGGGVGDSEQLLTLNASLGVGYDDDLLAGGAGNGVPSESAQPGIPSQGDGPVSGAFSLLSAGLSYGLSRSRVGFNASESSAVRYYPDLSRDYLAGHSGAVGGWLQLTSSTRLTANSTATYQPLFTFQFLPDLFDPQLGQAVTVDPSIGTTGEPYVSYSNGVELSQKLSDRSSVAVSYVHNRSQFSSDDLDLRSQTIAGRFSRGLAKGLSMRIGYGRSKSQYGGSDVDPVEGHVADIGVDFNRALSFSRRTTLSFQTGSAAIVEPERTYYRLIGNARLIREIGRTWNVALSYSRNVDYEPALRQPVFSDAAIVGIGGMLNRRVQFNSSIGAAFGNVGFTAEGNSFDTYYGNAGLTFGFTRYLGFSVDYSYYRYSFEDRALLPAGVPSHLNRQSARAYLNVWAPLVHRARRPDASR